MVAQATHPVFTLTPSHGRVLVRKYVPGVREPIVEIDWSITELAAMVAYLLTEVEEYNAMATAPHGREERGG